MIDLKILFKSNLTTLIFISRVWFSTKLHTVRGVEKLLLHPLSCTLVLTGIPLFQTKTRCQSCQCLELQFETNVLQLLNYHKKHWEWREMTMNLWLDGLSIIFCKKLMSYEVVNWGRCTYDHDEGSCSEENWIWKNKSWIASSFFVVATCKQVSSVSIFKLLFLELKIGARPSTQIFFRSEIRTMLNSISS